MLSVLYIDESGYESVFEAETVNSFPKAMPDQWAGVVVNLPGGESVHYPATPSGRAISGRKIFVMNGNGKTVARYDL